DVIRKDADVVSLSSFVGVDASNATPNTGRILINLKPKSDRSTSVTEVMTRLMAATHNVQGISIAMQPVQDLTVESTVGSAQYQFALEAASGTTLTEWLPRLLARLQSTPEIANVSTNFLDRGLTAFISIDRDTAARFGITAATIDNALY